jgi:hypothetical protein
MNFYYFIIICFYILISKSYSSQKSDYDLLLEWGKNNSLRISDKIKIEYINENNKTYYAVQNILKGEEILTIPNSIVLNIKNTLLLYGNKARKLYSKFNSEFNESSNFNLEQAFLAFIMHKVNSNKKLKENNFYKYYQYLFNTFETNFDSYPIFYSLEQLNLIRGTSLRFLINQMKNAYDEEIKLYEKLFKQKKINNEDYYVFRTYSSSKSFNISGHASIIPFLDMIEKHPTNYNLEVIASDFDIRVIATKDIYPSEKLFIKSDTLTNHNALIYFGVCFEEIIERIEKYYIPILNPLLIQNYKIDLKEDSSLADYFTNYIDIKKGKNEFYIKYLDVYKKLTKKFGLDDTDLSAYKLILDNLLTLKEINEGIKDYVYKIFYTQKDINNILIIVKTENIILEDKIDLMRYLIDNIEKNKKEDDIEDINFDL